ncbi:MAG TPA: type II toxin-antitoxin system VapC family toxin [Rhizobiaceae bacterium]|nr:type II toxin-antitoxin system VapC family toxin [Rhizobiaceae bacterium]
MPEAATSCVIDTSALVAILAREPDAITLIDALGYYPHRILPPSCIVELCSLRTLPIDMPNWLSNFIDEYEVAVVPMSADIAWRAAAAAIRYGRGSGHAAKLNFGDCMSYAFSRHFDAPLLFKGDDFTHTDLTSALA